MRLGIEDVVAKVSASAFGTPLVTNVLRGHVVEAVIALALEPEWRWCSADYAAWDFERGDGLRLEVRQSAFRQSWVTEPHIKIVRRFDIGARKYAWEGSVRSALSGRAAQVYVFAYHDVRDDTADHRDPKQWEFYVVPASLLPHAKSISIAGVRRIAEPISLLDRSERLRLIEAGG